MTWSFVGKSAPVSAAGVTSVVLNVPAGVASGDFMVIALQGWGSGSTITAPTGWTVLKNAGAWNGGENYLLAYKIASGSEPSSYTVTASANWWPAGWIYVIRASAGCAYGQSAFVDSTTRGTSQPAASLTGVAASSAVVYGYGGDNSAQSSTNTLVLPTPSNLLSGSSSGDQNNPSGGSDYGILTCTGSSAPGGATSTGSIDYYDFAIEVTTSSSTNATVTGVGATVSVAGGVGSPVVTANTLITGVGAEVSVAAGLGSPTVSVSTPGAAALVTVAAGVGETVTTANVTIAGAAAQVTVAGGVGTPSSSASITGVAASVTLTAGVGVPSGSARIVGVGSAVSVSAGVGEPHSDTVITGVGSQVSVDAGIGTVNTGSAAVITGVGATVTVDAGTGDVQADAVIAGVAAEVTVAAGIGSVTVATPLTGTRLFNGAAPTDNSYSGVYTVGLQFSLSQPAPLIGIWWWSQFTDGSLPSWSGIWDVETQDVVPGTENISPDWDGDVASGWVKCSYDGSVILEGEHKYYVSVLTGDTGNSHTVTADYFTDSVTVDPITAPSETESIAGQNAYATGSTPQYPAVTDGGGINLWVDVEVIGSIPAEIDLEQNAPTITTVQVAATIIVLQGSSSVATLQGDPTVTATDNAPSVSASNEPNGTVSLQQGI